MHINLTDLDVTGTCIYAQILIHNLKSYFINSKNNWKSIYKMIFYTENLSFLANYSLYCPFNVSRSGREPGRGTTLHVVAAILRTLHDLRMLPVCSSI